MVTIRKEIDRDAAARETLLDVGYGDARFTKASERLRAGRLPALALVTCDHGQIIGTVRLWDVAAGDVPALLLGPLTVHPNYRRRGIASRLVRQALERAKRLGHRAVLLVGDPSYYGRFGFTREAAGDLWLAGRYDADRLLALELQPGTLAGARGLVSATGRVAPKRAVGQSTATGRRLPVLRRVA
jgi:predicted N-acetyltransferase YhbS